MTDDDKLLASLTGFTPGNWRAIPQGGSSTVVAQTMPPRNERRSEVAYGYASDNFCIGYPFVDDDRPDSCGVRYDFVCFGHADAQLIAAAPDLHRIATEQAVEIARLREALSALMDLNDNHSPFGGEMYHDRIDRTWDNARAALKDYTNDD